LDNQNDTQNESEENPHASDYKKLFSPNLIANDQSQYKKANSGQGT
jgi:hypothetical protein